MNQSEYIRAGVFYNHVCHSYYTKSRQRQNVTLTMCKGWQQHLPLPWQYHITMPNHDALHVEHIGYCDNLTCPMPSCNQHTHTHAHYSEWIKDYSQEKIGVDKPCLACCKGWSIYDATLWCSWRKPNVILQWSVPHKFEKKEQVNIYRLLIRFNLYNHTHTAHKQGL